MCGRYSLYTGEDNQEIMKIIRTLDEKYPGNMLKQGEIFPTNVAAIILKDTDKIIPELSIWGFPRFGKSNGVIINARSETVNERPMFRKSFYERRCVIPSTGFYEWTQNVDKKKYRFTLPGTKTLYMAGIFNEFKEEYRFAILTTNANNSVADVHNRMPVILKKEMIEYWIKLEEFALSYINANMPQLIRELSE